MRGTQRGEHTELEENTGLKEHRYATEYVDIENTRNTENIENMRNTEHGEHNEEDMGHKEQGICGNTQNTRTCRF